MAGGLPLSPHTSFNSSPLIRLLAELDPVAVDAPSQTFAERLSLWLGWTDAIPLSAALGAASAAFPAPMPDGARAAAVRASNTAFDRVREDLARAISNDALWAAEPAEPVDFSPHRHRIQSHQRAMAARIGPLRNRVRAALQAASADLGRLAALDAALDRTLGPREQHLLASLATRLERHAQSQPGTAWGPAVRDALLAELELRLQPIAGLIEALDHPTLTTSVHAPQAVGQS